MAAGARVKDIRWWEGKKDVVLHLEEKARGTVTSSDFWFEPNTCQTSAILEVQFSLRLQPGKQLVGPFVGPVAGLYPEGRVTQAVSFVRHSGAAPIEGSGQHSLKKGDKSVAVPQLWPDDIRLQPGECGVLQC